MEKKRISVTLAMGACFMVGMISSWLWYRKEIDELSWNLKSVGWYNWVLEDERDRLQQEVDSLKSMLIEYADDSICRNSAEAGDIFAVYKENE